MRDTTLTMSTRRDASHIDLRGLDAFILDMDGVVTNTARIHATAWKQTFDEYLQERAQQAGGSFRPFDLEADYLTYVDGKPRWDGVRDFLRSRQIDLPFGDLTDPPEKETVGGIGNRKNGLYLRLLEEQGADPYPSTVELVRWLRSKGIRTALISASRNARKVLQSAHLTDLFDVVVDGIDAGQLKLQGKPAPDIFLEAGRRLQVGPDRSAVIEDSLAGVEAAKAGGFALVIGVDRGGQEEELHKHGADVVVSDLSELGVDGPTGPERRAGLPSALDNITAIFKRLQKGVPAVFLDYDGTLTPIVRDPRLAIMSEEIRDAIHELATICLVSVVSGRDLQDVRNMVGLSDLAYVGSHGFEIMGPDGSFREQERGRQFLPSLDAAEGELRSAVKEVKGAWVDRKRFAIAVHYRLVTPGDVPRLEGLFKGVVQGHKDLKMMGGKKVFELRPNMNWDKGRAVLTLLDLFHVDGSLTVPLYIGDDVTDEDAFRALGGQGISILVSDHPQETAANYVLNDVAEVHRFLDLLALLFKGEAGAGIWTLRYDGFEPEQEKLRETLCTTGNGYFASRGAAPESVAGKVHYPGNYLAGVYNRLISHIDGHVIENESMVNGPNWLCLSFRIDGGEPFDIGSADLLEYHQELDMRRGTYDRTILFADPRGRRTRVYQRKFVSMDSPHHAGLETTITPEDWSGSVQVLSALDGNVDNALVERYQQLDDHHLVPIGTGTVGEDVIWLEAETNQSHIRLATAARTAAFQGVEALAPKRRSIESPGFIGQELDIPVERGRPTRIEKIVTVSTSRDRAISESRIEALQRLGDSPSFDQLLGEHAEAWSSLWARCAIEIDADHEHMALILNLHIFHLLQTVSAHSIDLDVGVPPRGLHGEAYRGLIMWDEIFIFPFLNLRIPDLTRALLLYRYRRLPWAQRAARQAGLRGAMFPWQSGSDGQEEAQKLHLNPISGEWIPDYSHLERHISLAIGYNVWQYYQVSGDLDFMSFYGAKMMVEIARFWASKAQYSSTLDRYGILGVMGPDEFHEKYPGAPEPGVNNNAYTNVMAAWLFCRALDTLRMLPPERRRDLFEDLDISGAEIDHWEDISRKMFIPFHRDGIISQFEGYDDLKELDWKAYRKKYGNIHRLDRILKAEGDSPDRYKLSKQADVLMLFYLFSAEELGELFDRLGYRLELGTIHRTIDYYMDRTSHGSTLSRVVHAWVLSRFNREMSWNLFLEALRSDISDIQGGTTQEGIHLGAMAGTVDMVQRCYSGLETRGDVLWFNPSIPRGLKTVRFDIEYRSHWVNVVISKGKLRLSSMSQGIAPVRIGFKGTTQALPSGGRLEFDLL
jgi:alpha,alpha-trehalase